MFTFSLFPLLGVEAVLAGAADVPEEVPLESPDVVPEFVPLALVDLPV